MAEAPAPAQPIEAFQKWTELAGRSQQMMLEFWSKEQGTALPSLDPLGAMATWQLAMSAAMADPQRLLTLQSRYMTDAMALWQSFLVPGSTPSPVGAVKDKRFAGEAWQEAPAFDFLRQSYLLASNYILEAGNDIEGLDAHEKTRARFFIKQFVDAMSPSNFALTNPEVLKKTAETGGANLLKGLEHMMADMSAGRMKMTDENAFEVGRNVAVTPGKVVFENRLFQLIQYSPTTAKVYKTPLLIFPPWINKFYILDLTAEKSFIRWAVEQGLTVFVTSWKNADASLADVTLDHYVGEGQITALDTVLDICGTNSAHTIGYCVAGTTLAATLAVLAARGEADKVRSATFFTAQVDMSECGELGVFIDNATLDTLGKLTADKPWLDGRNMAMTFNMLRSNDLIWSYVVNNYLIGKDYMPFDLLYWNSDATNVPALWHRSYLEDIYRDNLLVKPGGLTVLGVPIDLTRVATPSYIQGGKEDHIAPARSAYKLTSAFTGEKRFVLAGSGHIAGVVNPPSAKKYQYWTSDTLPERFDDFVASAAETKGSWWPDWIAWLAPRSGAKVAARVPGSGAHKAIEDAPGRYVKERIG
ncbi:PHA/PHB synthase family protein [Polymorphobacter fuscus]|uniref:Class I poly(R)-hydroxyalkanoic acid synthase n=1 Tax=Sandarakinorhabdus fusca TaxID=1439888 RepID=A0A7C9GME0_9SPHN|nr:class I poly(R)-hydroxyalkanoic acid synthase [Polymorphobacter fuscus]KAB7648420.1 class I poly(R)-hydroxyalkanoic acid synthase [Polymorphobacter fuscus]MQT15937.1 class I poly(R)-hydroxyalkanoic acid synthase [Polymorphobacter fuscus]NJC07787.1 polyhydroxyalkanoate synthase [Polymorphobacter fuscus]